MRAADTDRERVAEQLRSAHADGRLDLSEYDQRLQQAWAAQTCGELEALTSDLPGARAAVAEARGAINGFAVASLVLGILWLYWIGSILALVFGYIARKQIRERKERGAGLATAGIVLGWVGVGILVILFLIGLIGLAVSGA
ncbi:MAG: DUF1707 and DUF4190 domain-containing protein [Pseudonocardiaceae bacterium]